MTAYLYKFTDSNFVAFSLPCFLSIVQVMATGTNFNEINSVANYVATFFAY